MIRRNLSAVLLLGTVAVQAAAAPQSEAGVARLAADPTWLSLVHAKKGATGLRREIVSDAFYLTPASGPHWPSRELEATLAAFARPQDPEQPDAHAQCRYPARWLYLQRQPAIKSLELEPVACPAYSQWRPPRDALAISVVYATGFLSNPASFYGHMLLKFRSAESSRYADLLDVSVNYGAIVPNGIDPVSYMIAGVVGGFDGGFSHIEYYFHRHHYGESQLRDLWEYELDLSTDDAELVVAHAWELLGQRFTYYFFRRNCAYRIGELIELVAGADVIPPARPWTIPQSMLQRMGRLRIDGRPLVREIHHYPSRASRFYAGYQALQPELRPVLNQVARDADALDVPAFRELPAEQRIDVVDTAIDYLQFAEDVESAESDVAEHYRRLLATRFRLPAAAADTRRAPDRKNAPHQGRPPGYLRAGIALNDVQGLLGLVEVRPAYYEPLDAGPGHLPYSTLSMGGLTLALGAEDEVALRRLDLVRVDSIRPAVSGLPGDRGWSWTLHVGGRAQDLACNNCTQAFVDGAFGRALRAGPLVVGGLLGGGLQTERRGADPVRFTVEAFTQTAETSRLGARAALRLHQELGSRARADVAAEGELRYAPAPGWDLRIGYAYQRAHEGRMAIGYYW